MHPVFESLEPRQLLSASFTVMPLKYTPGDYLVGAKFHATGTVQNDTGDYYAGEIEAQVRLSTDRIWDNANDVIIYDKSWQVNFAAGDGGSGSDMAIILNQTPPGDYYVGISIYTPDYGTWGNKWFSSQPDIHVREPFVDLVPSWGAALNLPSSVVSGDGTILSVPLTITENGNIPVPKPGKIDIEIDARPQGAVDDSQDVRVGGVSGFSVAGLAPGHAKSTTVSASLPAGLPTDSYKLVAKIDAAGAVDDDTSNNTIVTPAAIDVTKGYVDLIGSFGKVSTPPCVVDYTPFSGKVPLIIQNAGNVAIPSGQKVNIAVVAHDTATGDDIPLTALTNQSISGLAADGIKTLLAKINKLPGGLDEGDYEIQATISPMGNLTEENPDNNVVTADALGSLVTLSVAPKFIDLAVGAPYLGFTGNIFMPNDNPKVKPKVSFTLCNIGNTNASGDVKFYLWAHNEVTRVNTLLARSTQTVSISWNGSKSLSFDYTIPSYLPAGQYTFSVELENTSTQLGKQDTNSNNNIGYNLTTYFRGGDIRSFASFSQQGDGTYELSVLTYEADVTNFGDPAGSYWVVPIHVTAVPANHQVTFSIDLPSDFYDVGLGQLIMVFPNNIPKKNTVSLSARARSVAFPIGRLYGPSSQWIAKTTTTITQLEYNVEGVDITLNVGDLGKRIASTDLDFEILILDGQFAGQNDGTSIATTWGTRFKGVAVGGSIGYAFA